MERPGHGVVLVAGDHHAAARLHQCVNGDIQSVGGVAGKDHIGFVLHAEQLRRSRPAGIVRFLRQLGSLMAAPPRRGHGIDRTRHGAADRTRLFQRSGSGIEIDHTATSLYPAPAVPEDALRHHVRLLQALLHHIIVRIIHTHRIGAALPGKLHRTRWTLAWMPPLFSTRAARWACVADRTAKR